MRTRYGVSPWIDTFPIRRRPDFPRLRGEHTADVVIVGGGLTGCATAYACAQPGMRLMLLEGGRIGQGGAGRSAGLLLPDPGPTFREVAQAHGLRSARRVFESWRRASIEAAAQLRRLRIPCALDAYDSVVVAGPNQEKNLRREFDARQAAGLEARWPIQKAVRQTTALDVAAGMRLRDSFTLDPYGACLGLAAAATRRGGTLFERSGVKKVRAGEKHVEILLDGAVIRAQTVIVTTGAATAEFQPLRRHFKRRETYLVLTEPMPAAMRKQLGRRDVTVRDTRSPRHRVRWTRDDRILVGGADQEESSPRNREAVLVQRTGQLMYELLMMYQAISGLRPAYGWEMAYGETADGLMYIGPHRNYPRHLFALGGGGDSITGAFLAARLLARTVRGDTDKGDEVFGWTR